MSSHTIEHRVQWGECDGAGIVFYPNYFRWFDHAGHEFLRGLGFPLEVLTGRDQIILPLIETGCRFHRPVRYGELLTIETRVTDVRTHAFRFEHRVSHDGAITGVGFEVRGWAPLPPSSGSIELVRIPDDIRARLL